MNKVCENCSAVYNARKSKQKFCSRKCTCEYRSKYLIGENASNYKNGNRMPVLAVCANCGKETLKEPQHIKRWKNVFCDRNCQAEYYRNHADEVSGENSPIYSKQDVSCEQCGTIFKTYNSTKSTVRFCSKKCRNDWQSEMMIGSKHYNWNGGTTNWKSSIMAKREYKNWRDKILTRDNFTCQECGAKDVKLNAHHIKSVVKNPELIFTLENGKTLCFDCHMKVHSKNKLDIQSEHHDII